MIYVAAYIAVGLLLGVGFAIYYYRGPE